MIPTTLQIIQFFPPVSRICFFEWKLSRYENTSIYKVFCRTVLCVFLFDFRSINVVITCTFVCKSCSFSTVGLHSNRSFGLAELGPRSSAIQRFCGDELIREAVRSFTASFRRFGKKSCFLTLAFFVNFEVAPFVHLIWFMNNPEVYK